MNALRRIHALVACPPPSRRRVSTHVVRWAPCINTVLDAGTPWARAASHRESSQRLRPPPIEAQLICHRMLQLVSRHTPMIPSPVGAALHCFRSHRTICVLVDGMEQPVAVPLRGDRRLCGLASGEDVREKRRWLPFSCASMPLLCTADSHLGTRAPGRSVFPANMAVAKRPKSTSSVRQ